MNTTTIWQAEAVHDIVVSLGWKATIFATVVNGFGLVKPGWQVWFTPIDGETIFEARPPEDFRPSTKAQSTRRVITSIVPVDSVPTQCIEVDSPDHLFLCGKQMVPTHNTNRWSPRREDLNGDVQLKGYTWLVHQNWSRWMTTTTPRVVTHLDAIKFRDVETMYQTNQLDEWEAWASAVARRILRDEVGKPILNSGCDWCELKATCPVILVLPQVGTTLAEREVGQSADEMWTYRQEAAKVVKALSSRIDSIDKTLAESTQQAGSLQFGDQRWTMIPAKTNVVDLPRLHSIMGNEFYEVVSTSRAAIERKTRHEPDTAKAGQMIACIDSLVTGEKVAKQKAVEE